MKRLLVSTLILFFLCGCAKTKTITPSLQSISFTVDVQYGNEKYQADANMQDNNLNFVVQHPEHINGLTLDINNNGTTASYKGISYPIDISSQPQGAMAQVLYNILSDVVSKELTYQDENCEISGRVDDYNYTFVFSPSGLPISLEVEQLDLFVKFSNVTLK